MKTCLVVDDSSVVRKVARRILEGMKFAISEAEDGVQALDMCRVGLPDVVFLDLNMPRMDGMTFLKEMRNLPAARGPRWCSARPSVTWRISIGRCGPGPTNSS
jgi:two-component system chemotaxis response regulator CheY